MIFDFICTYQLFNDFEDSNILYKIQLLQAFNLKDFDENIIDNEQKILYDKYCNLTTIKNIIGKIKLKHKLEYIENEYIIFKILFSYDYFYIFLSCLRELEYNKIINENTYNKLINIIN